MKKFIETLEENLIDIRQHWKIYHKLIDIIVIVMWGTLAFCDKWEEVEDFAQEYEETFRNFLELPNGIPSHDTMQRVMGAVDGEHINRLFVDWIKSEMLQNGIEPAEYTEDSFPEVVPIDGKTARGSKNDYHKAVHIVSAFCVKNSISLAQVKTNEKSNEITAIPLLLDMLDIKGQIVTIDAMGTQTDIAKKIIEDNEAEYILALKGNHKNLEQDVADYFNDKILLADIQAQDGSYHVVKEKSHNSIIKYEATITDDISWLYGKEEWAGLKTIGMIEKTMESIKTGEKTKEIRYYINSIDKNAELFYMATRAHWQIETSLHWHLDVTFREDANKTKDIDTVQNMNIIRKIALSILKQANFGKKMSIIRKRKALSMNFPKHMMNVIESI